MKQTRICIRCGIDFGTPSDGCCGIDNAPHEWKRAEPAEPAEKPAPLPRWRARPLRAPAKSVARKRPVQLAAEEPRTGTRWYNRSLAEYRERAKRVGITRQDRLRWLVGFGHNLDEPAEMLADMAVFMMIERVTAAGGNLDPDERPQIMPRYLNALAGQLAEGLEHLVDGKPWRFRLRLPVDLVVQRTDDHLYSAWEVKSDRASGFLSSFLLTTIDMVRAESAWLGRCQLPDCARLFVRDDRRARYCSPQHGQNRRTRKSREKPARRR
jgi:hypothetical protein